LTEIQKRCLDFCIELLNQRVVRREYDSAMVGAMAVLGLREKGWRTPEDYPPILSSVIKVARFMIIQKAIELAGPMPEQAEVVSAMDDADWEGDGAYGGSSAPVPAKGCLHWVSKMTDQFMVRGSQGPMQWLLDLRTYGMKIHYNTTRPGHVAWNGFDELLYQGDQFTMRQFRGMVHRVVHEARRILMSDLLYCREGGTTVPGIPWASMRDNATNEAFRWSFLQDPRTQWPIKGQRWLLDRMRQEPAFRRWFMQEDGQGFRHPRVDAYLRQVAEFLEKLLVAVQFTWGQPARAPELLSIRHANSIMGGPRNMFIEDGMVVLVTRYHKGYQMQGDVKIIHRYLPREVAELLIWYLWLVQPFQRQLESYIYRRKDIPTHVWARDHRGRPWTSERLRHIMQRESAIGLGGVELNIASYREIAIGISRRFMRASRAFVPDEAEAAAQEAMEDDDEAAAMARIADEQAGHTPHVAGMIYAREITERSGAVADRRQRFRTSSVEWHRFLGFASAMGHEGEDPGSRKRQRVPFEEEAEAGRMERWMRLRRMNAEAELKRMMEPDTTFRGMQKEVITAIAQGESPVVSVMPTGAGKSLLFMLPASVEPGGTTIVVVPLVALRADIRRRCQALGISCTEWESGRPADGASIVLVTPESAVSETFTTFINRKRWSHELDRIVIDECHIVLNDRYHFRKEMGQLGELVKGKTQMVLLTATLPRDEEAELCRRMYFEPSQVRWFRSRTARTNVAYRVIRMAASSRGARQQARRRGHRTPDMVVAWIRRRIARVGSGKVVIYASSVPLVKRLAQELGCDAYHSKAVDKPGMLEAFRQGVQPVIVATSALGMGIDIPDIRCVIHVGRTRTLLDYAQESGRAGRDGQRSEAIMILDGRGQHWGDPPEKDSSEKARELVQRYIDGPVDGIRCRRAVLDQYLDGEIDGYQRVQCEDSEEACDWCRGMTGDGRDEEEEEMIDEEEDEEEMIDEEEDEEEMIDQVEDINHPSDMPRTNVSHPPQEEDDRAAVHEFRQQNIERQGPSERFHEQQADEHREMESIRQQLAEWVGRCRVCAMLALPNTEHPISRCPREESRAARTWAMEIEQQVKEWHRQYEPYAACYGCHAPQSICEKWEWDSRGGYHRTSQYCQYDRVVISILAQLLHGPMQAEIWTAWRRRLAQWPDGAVDVDNRSQLVRHFQRRFGRRGDERSGLAQEMNWVSEWVTRELGH
jgi:superfamily II DNA helicase RecQ